ncbi:MAG TPA: hypothetical protein VJS44_18480 [Pyrinomonadaceae bacterium]|nr:hypothetical protein [Pyrinomonadaceae bacterium]
MTASTLTLNIEGKDAAYSRALGTAAIIASPMLLLSGLLYGFAEIPRNRITATLGFLFVLGWAASAIGLRLLKVTGTGVASKALFLVQIVLLLLAASQQVQEFVFEHPEGNGLIYIVADIAWPLSMLLMLIVGIFILKAGVWRGWRRVPALICGLSLPGLIIVGVTSGNRAAGGLLFGVATTVGFMLLGYAVRTGRPAGRI